MIRAVIVDDEPNTESIIRYFVDRGDLPIEIAGTANNGGTAVFRHDHCQAGIPSQYIPILFPVA